MAARKISTSKEWFDNLPDSGVSKESVWEELQSINDQLEKFRQLFILKNEDYII